jgi:hypothetical protein
MMVSFLMSLAGCAGVLPVRPIAPQPQPLPGEFVVRTLKQFMLSAVAGGGRTMDAIASNQSAIVGEYERFKFWSAGPSAIQYKYIQTVNGYFLMAPDGGGRTTSDAIVADLHQYPYGQYTDWAKFRFVMNKIGNTTGYGGGESTIQTINGDFVTAVGEGGRTTDVLHTDATIAKEWEYFSITKCGDIGSGFSYAIKDTSIGQFLKAAGGGGLTQNAVSAEFGISDLARFTLIRQADGSYSLQTPNGVNYVTAVSGGGLDQGSATPDILQTNQTQAQAWEKFTIVDTGDCTYTIQTVSGYYLAFGFGGHQGNLSTDISDPNAAPGIYYSAKFQLYMFDL